MDFAMLKWEPVHKFKDLRVIQQEIQQIASSMLTPVEESADQDHVILEELYVLPILEMEPQGAQGEVEESPS